MQVVSRSNASLSVSRRLRLGVSVGAMLSVALAGVAFADSGADGDDRTRSIRTFFVTRHIGHERFMAYIEAARPEVVQAGNYGAMFHGYVDDEGSTGWPMRLPTHGEEEVLAFQRDMNERIHALGSKVVGHFRLVNVLGDWEDRAGFIDWYDNRWSEELLGPKPHEDIRELLQRGPDGVPLMRERYPGRHYLHLCLSSPYARQLLKQMLDLAIDHGVDGVITTYNYHFACVCEYCQDAFKNWLDERLGTEELRDALGIESLEDHTFERIPARISGYPDPDEATALDWLAMRWGAEHFKRMYDRIFIEHGRAQKPDLIVATWNHLSRISRGEERAFLPIDLWGKGEDYFWYSGGASYVNSNLNLAEGLAGDAWLAMHYIRALGGGKPFVMGKYDRTRMEAGMAEGYATGGMGAGRYMQFTDDHGFEVLVRYTQFMHDHRHLYDDVAPHADIGLVLPRQSTMAGRPEALDAFRALGQAMVERQMMIDVVVDERLASASLFDYPLVVLPDAQALSSDQVRALRGYVEDGGTLLVFGEAATRDERGRAYDHGTIDGASVIGAGDTDDPASVADAVADRLREVGGSSIDTRWTVRAAAYVQPERMMLHLVNYDREADAPETNRTGPDTELPRPVHDVRVDLRLPEGKRAAAVTLHAPDRDTAEALEFDTRAGRTSFTVPRVFVYGLVEIEFE